MNMIQPKRFCYEGPIQSDRHYAVPALPRLRGVLELIDQGEYFSVQGPIQCGKTTSVLALVDHLNKDGSEYVALRCGLNGLSGASGPKDFGQGFVTMIRRDLSASKVGYLKNMGEDDYFWEELKDLAYFSSRPIGVTLSGLAGCLERKMVVFFDDFRDLPDSVLSAFLSQLETGLKTKYGERFPHSLALVGLGNVMGHAAQRRPLSKTQGFSIPPGLFRQTLTLSYFTPSELKLLYAQHTQASGQPIDDLAVQRVWRWTKGQPRLVNALVGIVNDEILKNDYGKTVTADRVDQAAYLVMNSLGRHMDPIWLELAGQGLREGYGPTLAFSLLAPGGQKKLTSFPDGDDSEKKLFVDDLNYCLDLGLLKGGDAIGPANPIYASFIVRILYQMVQRWLPKINKSQFKTRHKTYMDKILKEFQALWSNDFNNFLNRPFPGLEPVPAVFLTAFINAILSPLTSIVSVFAEHSGIVYAEVNRSRENFPLALVTHHTQVRAAKGQEFLLGHMDRLGAKVGWLVFFEQKPAKNANRQLSPQILTIPSGQTIRVYHCRKKLETRPKAHSR
ncbi:MAG: ATP-binding protein [Deltaproteobacteria bacterium]|jgi:hypothetical protein|nr:ATP-binding protein [Deltaproteobacteria bacterium]